MLQQNIFPSSLHPLRTQHYLDTTQQPASKRQRNDSNTTANSNNNTTSNSTSTRTTALNPKQDSANTTPTTLLKRVATRRQSIAGLPTENHSSSSKTHDKVNCKSSSSATTTHTLRTRLSVPLTNKAEKR